MPTSKQQIRQSLRTRRADLSPDARTRAGNAVAERLSHHLRNLRATKQPVAGFMPNDGEIPLTTWIRDHLAARGTLVLPRVTDDAQLEFAPVDDLDALQPGRYGIPEPTSEPIPIEQVAAFLVPGVAFDHAGGRIGMGAGYYDRALQRHQKQGGTAPRIGVAYDFQLLDSPLPTQPHDIPMTHIVTPSHSVSLPSHKT